jgi:transglutaminase-like putative cysteine protease
MSAAENSHAWNMVYSSSRGWFRLDLSSADNGIMDAYAADDANYTDLGWY